MEALHFFVVVGTSADSLEDLCRGSQTFLYPYIHLHQNITLYN